jgi:hypothetical protein
MALLYGLLLAATALWPFVMAFFNGLSNGVTIWPILGGFSLILRPYCGIFRGLYGFHMESFLAFMSLLSKGAAGPPFSCW